MTTDLDEQLRYFLVLARLLDEADLQLQAGAEESFAGLYADELQSLITALGSAVDAAMAIIARVHMERASFNARTLGLTQPAAEALH